MQPGNGRQLDQGQVDALAAALVRGRKIEAIKIYRAATGVGLKEAKAAVDSLEAGLPPSTGVAAGESIGRNSARPLEPAALVAVQAELARGQKIRAIKAYREATGASLLAAKRAVEAIAVGRSIPPASAEIAPRPPPVLAYLVAFAALAGFVALALRLFER